jgi:phytoene dehydrogenase-like protein
MGGPGRRDVLKGLLGLGATACWGRPAGRTIGGSIVGGAHRRGHTIRDGRPGVPDVWEDVPVAIVGAGVAGLSAAWTLERAGLRDFVVLELEDAPGGTARSGSGPVVPYPWGAHYVPVPSPANAPLVALLDEVGAVERRDAAGRPVYDESVLCGDPQERVFYRGEWYEGLYPRAGASTADIAELLAFEDDMRAWGDRRDEAGRRAFDLPRARGSDSEDVRALDRMSRADYLERRGWRSSRLRWFVEYGCRDDFGASLAQTSAWAGVHYFAARQQDDGEAAPFLTWPEGNGRLVSHLAGLAGPRLRLGALVAEVVPSRDRVSITCVEPDGRVRGLRAEHAVLALPRFLHGYLLGPRGGAPSRPPAPVYGAWMVANLTLHDRPGSRGFPLAWDNVLYDSPSLGYVVATHQANRDRGPTVLTYYLPLLDDDPRAARRRLLETSWEEWVRVILADLAPAHLSLRDLVETVDVYLWGHAMVRPRPGDLWSPALSAAAQPLGRLHFAHTDLSGWALFEEAQYWGVRAAEAILRERKAAFRPWLP